jgi:hypothetical protein
MAQILKAPNMKMACPRREANDGSEKEILAARYFRV